MREYNMAEVFTKPSRRIQNMIAKELRLIVKDRVALFLIFLLPAVSIGMLYYVTQENDLSGMGGGDMGEIEDAEQFTGGAILGLIDLDTTRTYEGEDLSGNFTGYMEELVDELIVYTEEADAYQDMYDKVIMGYVVIPDGFERNLTLNEPTYVTVHVDATNFIEQSTVMGVVQGASITFRATHLWIESEVFPAMMIEFMPTGGYVEIVFGGFIVIFSSYLGIAMTSAQSIVGDIPLRRMLLTPTSRLEVVVSKVISYVIIGFFQSLLLVSLWVIAFNLTLNTEFAILVLIMSTRIANSVFNVKLNAMTQSETSRSD